MWSPTSFNQTNLQRCPALWKPAMSRTGNAELPAWESFPSLERRELIEALVRTARRRVREHLMSSVEAGVAEVRA
jgi:hypothetical protein